MARDCVREHEQEDRTSHKLEYAITEYTKGGNLQRRKKETARVDSAVDGRA